MARPIQRKAAKDYPENGIKKGDTYWYVKIKTGPRSSRVMRQKEKFKPQQLTSSEFMSSLHDWQEQLGSLDSMENAQSLADAIRELGEEQTSKKEGMPDGLQQGDTGQLLETRAEACEAAATEIEAIISDWESAKEEHDDKVDEFNRFEERDSDRDTAIAKGEDPGEELEEVEDPGEFDEDEFIDRVKEVSVDV